MGILVILALLLVIVILLIGIKKEKKKRIKERNEMFYDSDMKFEENQDGIKVFPSNSIDAVEVLSKILSNELEMAIKSGKKKSTRKKKPEFPIEPVVTKPKSKKGKKPKNKDKKGGDEMLLS
jgi:hypothetical protein